MSILRDERLIALHDLVEACRASASHCRLAAEALPDGDGKARDLEALAAQRDREADFFGERMIAEDDIPGGPPEERSLLDTALARGKAALGEDEHEALLAECRAQEEALVQQAEAAQGAPLKSDEKKSAAALADDARQRLASLFKA